MSYPFCCAFLWSLVWCQNSLNQTERGDEALPTQDSDFHLILPSSLWQLTSSVQLHVALDRRLWGFTLQSEAPISVRMPRSTYSLQTHIWAPHCSYKIGRNHSTTYLSFCLFTYSFSLSLTLSILFDDISHALKGVISGWPTHRLGAGSQFPLNHKHRLSL